MVFKKAPIVSCGNQPVLLFQEPHRTLLSALEAKKVRIFSECRSGFCGACKTRLLQGEVRYLTPPLAALGENECLPCCCVPVTDISLDLSCEGAEIAKRQAYNPVKQALETS
ncbi:hypothetical protein NFHSH190041_16280 [Shewanella sp. NFH-SH190041]|uniref:class I ribonucleotide reductase maintenance protein YfaE n=1 Tax=Shewanella sp. NFH-SH190041 TaxID=2950245 RepID=UPI0021C297CC|nr:class I ribonucleotide reductase maintenance protein YfaE [Shewanella sp. NFH-SH190041]BDM64176.1 hypothetical protein NFHSH190041_16280 [Shewanella sp. NFH-SH190041]